MPDLSPDQFQPPTPLQEHPEGHWGRKGPQPGKQGELVSGGRTQPWPRGYSPERRSEVESAMPPVTGDSLSMPRKLYERTTTERSELGHSPTKDRQLEGRARRLTETVARTSIPVSDLEGISEIRYGGGLPSGAAGAYDPGMTEAEREVYKPPKMFDTHQNRYNDPTILLGGAGVMDTDRQMHTMAHEIGHHVSSQRKTPHSASERHDVPSLRGQEEGFADLYAATHTARAPKKYSSQSQPSAYPDRQLYYKPDSPEAAEFTQGYREKKPGAPQRQITPPMVNVETPEPIYRDPNSGEWDIKGYQQRRARQQ